MHVDVGLNFGGADRTYDEGSYQLEDRHVDRFENRRCSGAHGLDSGPRSRSATSVLGGFVRSQRIMADLKPGFTDDSQGSRDRATHN
jgi:hypothetical protein